MDSLRAEYLDLSPAFGYTSNCSFQSGCLWVTCMMVCFFARKKKDEDGIPDKNDKGSERIRKLQITNQRHVKNLRWRTESLSLLHGSNGDFHSFCCIIALPSKHTWLYKAEAHFYVSSLRAYVLHAMRGRIASVCNLRYTQGLNAMLYSGLVEVCC